MLHSWMYWTVYFSARTMDGEADGGNNGSMSDMAGALDRSRGRPEGVE